MRVSSFRVFGGRGNDVWIRGTVMDENVWAMV